MSRGRQLTRPSMLTVLAASAWLVAGCATAQGTDAPETAAQAAASDETRAAHWRRNGRATVEARQVDGNARNVILFVGDGMGISTVTAARIRAGQLAGRPGEEHALAFERFPELALSKTYNINQQTSDSAGTMTAMITGVKTLAGVLSVDGSVRRGDCRSAGDAAVPSLVELAEDAGLATGVVSTARITHATPGATYAHTPERNWEADSDMPPIEREAGCRDIASQLVEFDHGDGIELVLGGGRARFFGKGTMDPEYPDDPRAQGRRSDGRNLVAEWQRAHRGGHWVWNDEQFAAIPDDGAPVLGLFEPSHMQWEADRPRDGAGEPSLAEMTRFAIERLSDAPRGYLLVIEAGRIDHAHHAANAYRALGDTIALSDAVAVADELTSAEDTLIVVTADHSHTLTIAGYPTRGNPILGLVRSNDETGAPTGEATLDALGRPYTTLAYANGAGWHGATDQQGAGPKRFPHFFNTAQAEALSRADVSDTDVQAPNYLQEAAVPLMSETHGGEDVAIYARGPGARRIGGVVEQSVIYYALEAALSDRIEPPAAN